MVSLFSVVFTGLALILIPGLFISWRLSVPISFKNVLGFIKLITSRHDDEEERNEKRYSPFVYNHSLSVKLDHLQRWVLPPIFHN